MTKYIILLSLFFSFCSFATEDIRLATYNSKFLSACMKKIRVINYQEAVEKLDADVVALQEVRDRFAVERFFATDQWNVIIDDESTDDMNLAFAIRHGIDYRLASANLKNADENSDFAFSKTNSNFIDERRVLKVYITYKGHEVLILNHHAKSRYNGRGITDEQRTQSSLDLIEYISQVSTPYVALLGDFNDTPDDRSLNTLENGSLSPREKENRIGTFLVNLTEPLAAEDRVSFGLKSLDTTNSIIKRVESSIAGSRQQNLDNFKSDTPVVKALYDQILVTKELKSLFHSSAMARTFDWLEGTRGNEDTRASDHIPIVVNFNCPDCDKPSLKIKSLLPNPSGSDSGQETITIYNAGSDFDGQIIIQDASLNNEVVALTLPYNQTITHTVKSGVTLNNSGDTIRLLNRYEFTLDEVTYSSSKTQTEIHF